jgi:hypothetical protein
VTSCTHASMGGLSRMTRVLDMSRWHSSVWGPARLHGAGWQEEIRGS